jgi:DNA-binding CsgD family transcriptional regulator
VSSWRKPQEDPFIVENITVSTVEQHLTRVYRKLNVAGREDLAVRLHSGTPVANSV